MTIFMIKCLVFMSSLVGYSSWKGGGGLLPTMAFTGRPRPKGVPFSGFRYMKG